MNKIKNKKAFTLIELIVSLAIIAILVLLSPKFIGSKEKENIPKAEITVAMNNSDEIEKAAERYYLDNQDWPRLSDTAYTSEQITVFTQEIKDKTGQIVNLDPNGSYYDIDYSKLQTYMQKPVDSEAYIIQNPVGNVYYLSNLTQKGISRLAGANISENIN